MSRLLRLPTLLFFTPLLLFQPAQAIFAREAYRRNELYTGRQFFVKASRLNDDVSTAPCFTVSVEIANEAELLNGLPSIGFFTFIVHPPAMGFLKGSQFKKKVPRGFFDEYFSVDNTTWASWSGFTQTVAGHGTAVTLGSNDQLREYLVVPVTDPVRGEFVELKVKITPADPAVYQVESL